MSFLIQEKISLSNLNWFETGGEAKYFAEPKNLKECEEIFKWNSLQKEKIFILGSGANVLISDTGINGLVIKPKMKEISFIEKDNKEVYVNAGAGVEIDELIEYCLNNCISGLEEFSGIPGKIGGAVYINIHYFKFLLSDFLYSAKVFDIQENCILDVDNAWFEFGYNKSKLLTRRYCLLEATFKLKKISELEAAFQKGRSAEIIRHRKQRYPYKGTCGSFFRNFHENEVTLESDGRKIIFAAYYLDAVNVKGSLKIGNAGVSHKHANMIVNFGGATTEDILNVAREMQRLVKQKFGILLKTECELLGFNEYPLER